MISAIYFVSQKGWWVSKRVDKGNKYRAYSKYSRELMSWYKDAQVSQLFYM